MESSQIRYAPPLSRYKSGLARAEKPFLSVVDIDLLPAVPLISTAEEDDSLVVFILSLIGYTEVEVALIITL